MNLNQILSDTKLRVMLRVTLGRRFSTIIGPKFKQIWKEIWWKLEQTLNKLRLKFDSNLNSKVDKL